MPRKLPSLAIAVLMLSLPGCAGTHTAQAPALSASTGAQEFSGMGSHRRPITTNSKLAQRYFDQGLTWTYAFNHDEAIRSFTRAAELDRDCAMAWWGVALAHGPHINNPMMPDERSAAAWEALNNALERIDNTTPVERMLIEALAQRYANPWPEDRGELDQAYADAMADVYAAFPNDSDVVTLYAESLMDLHPWSLYTPDREPLEAVEPIVVLLERARAMDPGNPGAHHLYIHAVEPSNDPSRALPAADALRDLVPASGHLTHMPSHIDVLVGQWNEAIIQNEKSMRSDAHYRAIAPPQDFQHLYMSHNSHMLAFAAMMAGREAEAMAAARAIWHDVPQDKLEAGAVYLDTMMCAVYDVQKRFGRWDEILAEPAPPVYLPITAAMWRANRAIAYAAKKDFANAEREQAAFRQKVASIPADHVMAINPAHDVLAVADHLVTAEIALQKGDLETAASQLREGVALEDQLLYMEPPEWIQPSRHTLGAVLLATGAYDEAELVYRGDLEKWPNNGWSLYGLSRALEGQGRMAEANAVRAQYEQAWAQADAPTTTSCACIPAT